MAEIQGEGMKTTPYVEPTPEMARAILRWQMRLTEELSDDARERVAQYAARGVNITRAPVAVPDFVAPLIDMLCTDAGLAFVREIGADLMSEAHALMARGCEMILIAGLERSTRGAMEMASMSKAVGDA
jgi:hypothetical protein